MKLGRLSPKRSAAKSPAKDSASKGGSGAGRALGACFVVEAVILGLIHDWVWMAVSIVLGLSAFLGSRTSGSAAVIGALSMCFASYLTIFHANTIFLFWPLRHFEGKVYVYGNDYVDLTTRAWCFLIVYSFVGVLMMVLAFVFAAIALLSYSKNAHNKSTGKTTTVFIEQPSENTHPVGITAAV